jgi:hypothetical protein
MKKRNPPRIEGPFFGFVGPDSGHDAAQPKGVDRLVFRLGLLMKGLFLRDGISPYIELNSHLYQKLRWVQFNKGKQVLLRQAKRQAAK